MNPIAARIANPRDYSDVMATLQQMRRNVLKEKASPIIRGLALRLVSRLRQKDHASEIHLLHKFVRDRIRYVRDTTKKEQILLPSQVIRFGQDDCDGKSVLLAALLESIGFRTRFLAIGTRADTLSHVLVEVLFNGNWIPLETTEPYPAGKMPPHLLSMRVAI